MRTLPGLDPNSSFLASAGIDGNSEVVVYDGASWSEWIRDPQRPVAANGA